MFNEMPPSWDHDDVIVNGVRLHTVCAGPKDSSKPPVILLHGFPEFWYGWRHQIPALAAAGFRVTAPDMRGYNTSDKPRCVVEYRIEKLVADLVGLIDHVGGHAHVVGHDWGGIVAWYTAMWAPQKVKRLVILNAAHPAAYLRELRRPRQLLKSWYVFGFQLSWLPEAIIRSNDFRLLRKLFSKEPVRDEAFSATDIDRYVEAFRQPGALTSAINYYRAALRSGPDKLKRRIIPIHIPTLLIWGEKDRYMVKETTEGLESLVPHLQVRRFPNATHWIQHDEPERVNALLVEHLNAIDDG
jgi:pimeloyl-ACP methyl ester carboxylesterase